MTLTKVNMRTDPTGNRDSIVALLSDIHEMDEHQLEKYLRLAFTDEIDKEFLPPSFWRGHSVRGGDALHGGPLLVGEYFGGQIYHPLYEAAIGFSRLRVSINLQTPLRFLRILDKILQQSIDYEEAPDEILFNLTKSAVDTAGSIRFNERLDLGVIYPTEHRKIFDLAKEIQRDPRYSSLSFLFVRAERY